MRPEREHPIRSLFDEYIEMYASRDALEDCAPVKPFLNSLPKPVAE